MRHIRRLFQGGFLIVSAVWFVIVMVPKPAWPAPGEPKAVELKVVKYTGLQEAVKAQRGKVVVVDVWGEF